MNQSMNQSIKSINGGSNYAHPSVLFRLPKIFHPSLMA